MEGDKPQTSPGGRNRDEKKGEENNEDTTVADKEEVPSAKRAKVSHSSESSSDEEGRDPGKYDYKEFSKALRALYALTCDPNAPREEGEEHSQRLREESGRLRQLCHKTAGEGEHPNPFKLLQIHLKHTLLQSAKIKGEENVKMFLCGLEDGSAGRSNNDDSVFVFLAKHATELWYHWKEEEQQWYWTPDRENHMPCSSDAVTGGPWEGETPAPENVEIIAYLDALHPIPTDEQYIPYLEFDVLKVLEGLVCCGDAEAEGNGREVVEMWREARKVTNSSNEHVQLWLKRLESLSPSKKMSSNSS